MCNFAALIKDNKMETTFVISQSELNSDFLKSLKKLFKHRNQLQITVSTAEDFQLLATETPAVYLKRLEKCLVDVDAHKNTIVFTEDELDGIILEAL
jgi:hypothetical protein